MIWIILTIVFGYLLSSVLTAYICGINEQIIGPSYGGWILLVMLGPIGLICALLFLSVVLFQKISDKVSNPWLFVYHLGDRHGRRLGEK